MRASRLAYCFLFSFLSTVFLLKWNQQSEYFVAMIFVLGLFSLFLVFIFIRNIRPWAAVGIATALGVFIALFVVSTTTHVSNSMTADTFATNEFTTIEGVIAEEPDRRPMQTKYTVAVNKLTQSGSVHYPIHGRLLATDRRTWPEYEYGDRVRVRGVLEKPGMIEEFSYDKYLSRYDIYAVMYSGSFEKIDEHNDGNFIFRMMYKTKETFEAQINRLYPEPHSSFMAGLLTGSRKGISDHLLQAFNITGLTHIIAISGYNITIVISVITSFLFWLPLKWRFAPAVIAIIAFTLFVGASAAVVRAAIMGILGLLALQVNRQAHVRLAVLWTAAFMVMWNPKYLWYDAGFQLSFLAVIGLTELSPIIERWFTWAPEKLGIREALQMTIAAQLAAVPLIVILFQRLSLIAPLANLLVGPFVPLAMLFGFLGTVVSFVSFPLGQLIAYVGWGALEWIIQVTIVLAKIPLASINTPQFGFFALLGYYALLVAFVIWFQKKSHHSYT